MKKSDKIIYGNGGGIPLRAGFAYADNDEWIEVTLPDDTVVDESHFGADDGLEYREGGCPLSTTDRVGLRGEAIYTVKTVYTDIKVDGERDPAYDYGLHLRGGIGKHAKYYEGRSTCIEVWMVRGQNGLVYVYGEITDPDIVVNDSLVSFKPHYCDALHPYVEYGNYGESCSTVGLIIADETGKYRNRAPSGCVVKLTDFGFKFEYTFGNRGKPLFGGDTVSFGFYYNDTNEYVDMQNYKRSIFKLPSRLNPEGSEYLDPHSSHHDAIILSEESATGAFEPDGPNSNQKSGDFLADILNRATSVKIVYPNDASGHTAVCARKLLKQLTLIGVKCDMASESEADEIRADAEIFLDTVSCPESDRLNGLIGHNGYGISFGERSIALVGHLEDALYAARDLFISALAYVNNGGKTSDLCDTYTGELECVACAPDMDGLTMITDAGNRAYLLLKQNAGPSDFDTYAEKLIACGYTLYTENSMPGVRCATYVGNATVVNLTYGENDRSLRAVVDQLDETALPTVEREVYKPVCKSSITQLAPSKVNMMTYIIKQDNGEFLVIDAGGNGAEKHIYESLLRLNDGKDVVVSSWIFTHFHCDHIGGFIELCDRPEYLEHITVKSVILNFPQQQVLDTASAFDHKNLSRWPGIMKNCGAKVYLARTGQKYYFGNVELEMLFTYEDLMPFFVQFDRTNPTSHIFSMKVDGQRFIMTGDACGEATRLVAMRYGKSLKSDFVQFPHHGMGDGGTAREFYEMIDAPAVFHPGYAQYMGKAEVWAKENSRHYFLNSHEDTTLDLPYNVN